MPTRKTSKATTIRLSPAKAVVILNKQINDSEYLRSEPFGSFKRDQSATTSRAVLEQAFGSDSSIVDSFETSQAVAFNANDSDEQMQQLANSTLSSMVAVLQSAVEQLHWQLQDVELPAAGERLPNTAPSMALFISHSSKDFPLATAVVDLFRSALGVEASQIRCSSVDGHRLPVGVNTESQLREEVNTAKVVVGLITPNSLSSHYVMFELGARWGAGSFLAPLLAGVPPNTLTGPLGLLNALSARVEAQLHQLLGDISNHLGVSLQPPASYQRHLSKVRELADAIPTGVHTQTSPSTRSHYTVSLRSAGEPPSQVIKLQSDRPLAVSSAEYLLSDGTCITTDDISLEGESFDVPLNYDHLRTLWNTPRNDRNANDHSGPAKVSLTITADGATRQLILPVLMQSLMRNNTFYINIVGSKTFHNGA